jgi:hypothetical protein
MRSPADTQPLCGGVTHSVDGAADTATACGAVGKAVLRARAVSALAQEHKAGALITAYAAKRLPAGSIHTIDLFHPSAQNPLYRVTLGSTD